MHILTGVSEDMLKQTDEQLFRFEKQGKDTATSRAAEIYIYFHELLLGRNRPIRERQILEISLLLGRFAGLKCEPPYTTTMKLFKKVFPHYASRFTQQTEHTSFGCLSGGWESDFDNILLSDGHEDQLELVHPSDLYRHSYPQGPA